MPIKDELLAKHSKSQAVRIAKLAIKSTNDLKQLMQCFFSNDTKLSQRAAWSVYFVAQSNNQLLKPYLKKIITNLHKKNLHDAVKRISFRLMDAIDFDEKTAGLVYPVAFEYLENKNEAIAIRVFAMTVMTNICGKYPELANELILFIENELEHEPRKAFISRAKRLLPALYRFKLQINSK